MGAYSITTVRTYVPTSVRPYVPYENGFRSIYFEKISILGSYFIHRYIIIKYRSSSIKGKIHQLLLGYGSFTTSKNGSVRYLLKKLVYWIYIEYTSI